MNKRFILSLIVIVLGIGSGLQAQTPEEFQANYNKRIKMEMINGVYIPYDLEDAFTELNRLADPNGLKSFKVSPEDSIRRKLHFGLGRWIMMNWGLEEGSRYSHHMKSKGVSFPDDIVEVTIITWHRRINGKPIQFEEEVARIDKRKAEEKAKRDAQKEVIILEKRPHKD